MGPRWRLIRSRELLSKETFQQHEVKMSYNLPLDFQWNMEVQIPVHLHKKKQVKYFVFFLTFLFSLSIMSNSSRCHGLQHARLPCPSPSPRVCSQSCPLSRWCHPVISSSVTPFFVCPQSFPASRSFPTDQLFASGGQSIGASASVLRKNGRSYLYHILDRTKGD